MDVRAGQSEDGLTGVDRDRHPDGGELARLILPRPAVGDEAAQVCASRQVELLGVLVIREVVRDGGGHVPYPPRPSRLAGPPASRSAASTSSSISSANARLRATCSRHSGPSSTP